VCHWTGIYYNGLEIGFKIFQEVASRLRQRYGDTLIWMKLGDLSRYWAARELTRIERGRDGTGLSLQAPFACPNFTLRFPATSTTAPVLTKDGGAPVTLQPVNAPSGLKAGTFLRDAGSNTVTACFALPKGRSLLRA
jgi:hypothetical protein